MTRKTLCSAIVALFLLWLIKIEGNSIPKAEPRNGPPAVVNQRLPGCRNTPWICTQGEFPPRSLCCNNRCVDVTADRKNCGMCGLSCIFNWQCCNRLCLNTNMNPFNCGKCGVICPFGRICVFGLCAYAQSVTPVPPVTPVTPPFPPAKNPPLFLPPVLPPEEYLTPPHPRQSESPSQPPAVE